MLSVLLTDPLYACVYRQLGTNLVVPGGARVIEAKGRLIIPGMSDVLYRVVTDLRNCL